jgi:hypothetical protein
MTVPAETLREVIARELTGARQRTALLTESVDEADLVRQHSPLLGMEARVDSALLWALVRHRLDLSLAPADALADTVRALRAAGVTGRFNFLLTDGQVIAPPPLVTPCGTGSADRRSSSPRNPATTSLAEPRSPTIRPSP